MYKYIKGYKKRGEGRERRRGRGRHTKLRSGDFLDLFDFGEPNPGEDFERFRTREGGSPRIEEGAWGGAGGEEREQAKGVLGTFRSYVSEWGF